MASEHINDKLRDLEHQIRTSYQNVSILDDVCTMQSVEENIQRGQFDQFASRYAINRSHIIDPSHFLLLGDLGKSVARSEINLLTREIQETARQETLDEISFEQIKDVVHGLIAQDYEPNVIFIPTDYFHDVHNWNSEHRPYGSPGSIFSRLYLDAATPLNVKYSSKYTEFENIIVTTKTVNEWQYRPDQDTQGRLTAKFDWNITDTENTELLIKTVFKFTILNNDANVVFRINSDSE